MEVPVEFGLGKSGTEDSEPGTQQVETIQFLSEPKDSLPDRGSLVDCLPLRGVSPSIHHNSKDRNGHDIFTGVNVHLRNFSIP